MTSTEVHVDTDQLSRAGAAWQAKAADYRYSTDKPAPPGDGNWSSHQGKRAMDDAMGQAGDAQHDELHRSGAIAQGASAAYDNTDDQQSQAVTGAGSQMSTSNQKDVLSMGTGALKDIGGLFTSSFQAVGSAFGSIGSSVASGAGALGNSLTGVFTNLMQSATKGMTPPPAGAEAGAHTAGMAGAAPVDDKGQDNKDREGHRDEHKG